MLLLQRLKILFFVFCAFLVDAVYAQNNKLDSLNQLIAKAKTDTARINLINKKISILANINLDSAIYYSLQNLKEAQKIKYYRGELDARMRLSTNYCFKGNYTAAKENLSYLEKFITPGKDSSDIADMYGNYGLIYGMQSKYDSSIRFYEKAIGINERNGHTDKLSSSYSNIAIGYQQTGNYPMALQYQQKSLKLAEKRNDEVNQAYVMVNLANTYEDIGDTLKAEQAYLKAVKLSIKKDLRNVELYAYTNLSSLYAKLKNWNKAYEFGMKAAELGGAFGDQGIKAASLSKAAVALANQNKFDEAVNLDRQAILLADSSNQPLNISQAYAAMGNIFFLQKKYKEAIPYYEKNFQALKGSDIYGEGTGSSYKELSECYEKTGDYSKALANFKIAADIADSIKRKENIRKATELSMNFEFEKKQEIQAAEKKRQDEIARTKQTALLVGLILAASLALVALNGYLNKKKVNRLLLLQKQKTETALNELEAAQAQLIQSEKMASLGELTAGIAHEIQNPLNFVNNFSEISTELVDEMNDELNDGNFDEARSISKNIQQNLEKINHHGKRADAIVKGMLMHSRKNTEEKTPTDINALCDEYLRLSYYGLRAKDKSFKAAKEIDVDSSLTPDVEGNGKIMINRQDIGRVLLNIFNNAFYAVTEKGRTAGEDYKPLVSVQTKKLTPLQGAKAKVEITIKDNGSGIPQNIVDKIFQPFFTTKPTGEGTGLGLSLAYDIITKDHNGAISVKSKEGEGTVFIIELPV
jgi:signal transduction histidine kinase